MKKLCYGIVLAIAMLFQNVENVNAKKKESGQVRPRHSLLPVKEDGTSYTHEEMKGIQPRFMTRIQYMQYMADECNLQLNRLGFPQDSLGRFRMIINGYDVTIPLFTAENMEYIWTHYTVVENRVYPDSIHTTGVYENGEVVTFNKMQGKYRDFIVFDVASLPDLKPVKATGWYCRITLAWCRCANFITGTVEIAPPSIPPSVSVTPTQPNTVVVPPGETPAGNTTYIINNNNVNDAQQYQQQYQQPMYQQPMMYQPQMQMMMQVPVYGQNYAYQDNYPSDCGGCQQQVSCGNGYIKDNHYCEPKKVVYNHQPQIVRHDRDHNPTVKPPKVDPVIRNSNVHQPPRLNNNITNSNDHNPPLNTDMGDETVRNSNNHNPPLNTDMGTAGVTNGGGHETPGGARRTAPSELSSRGHYVGDQQRFTSTATRADAGMNTANTSMQRGRENSMSTAHYNPEAARGGSVRPGQNATTLNGQTISNLDSRFDSRGHNVTSGGSRQQVHPDQRVASGQNYQREVGNPQTLAQNNGGSDRPQRRGLFGGGNRAERNQMQGSNYQNRPMSYNGGGNLRQQNVQQQPVTRNYTNGGGGQRIMGGAPALRQSNGGGAMRAYNGGGQPQMRPSGGGQARPMPSGGGMRQGGGRR